MTAVSVFGAYAPVQHLDYSATNLKLAEKLASKINARVEAGFIIPADSNTAPTVSGGYHEYVQTEDGKVKLPAYYDAVVVDTTNATTVGSSVTYQSVMTGAANATYRNNQDASGSIVFGDGQDKVDIGAKDVGAWNISVGNGQDTISAQGPGAATVWAGSGDDLVKLGSGKSVVRTQGQSTVVGGSGAATIFGGTGLKFVGGSGDAMVAGAQGGDNRFEVGSGNETLTGGAFDKHGTDVYVFWKDHAGGQDLINNFKLGEDVVDLRGFSEKEVQAALAGAQTTSAGMTITLSDNTRITLTDLTSLDPKSIVSH
jgi:hypothetical protein